MKKNELMSLGLQLFILFFQVPFAPLQEHSFSPLLTQAYLQLLGQQIPNRSPLELNLLHQLMPEFDELVFLSPYILQKFAKVMKLQFLNTLDEQRKWYQAKALLWKLNFIK